MGSKIANQIQTFYSSVRKTPFCWQWTGEVDEEGYAWIDIPRRPMRSIKFIYEAIHHPVPATKRLSLVCHNRLCVNPDHIEVRGAPIDCSKLINERPLIPGSRAKIDPTVKFWIRVNKNGPVPQPKPELGPCWVWVGVPSKNGYASIIIKRKNILVHRYSYLLIYDSIPDGLELDHLCRNKLCVNPKHLEAVTHAENMRRSIPYRKQRNKTHELDNHCVHGHEYTEENTYYFFDKEHSKRRRACRTCAEARRRKFYELTGK